MLVVRRVIALVALVGAALCVQAQQWQNLFPSFSGLTFGDDKFVAVSNDGAVKVFNKDAVEQEHFFTPNPLYAAAYGVNESGEDMFLATSAIRSSLISSNGINWIPTITSSSSQICRKLAFGKELFVGVGEGNRIFVYDYDYGWVELTNTSGTVVDVAFGANRFVTVGSTVRSAINDPSLSASWTTATGVSSNNLSLVTFGTVGGSPRFVAYGYTGSTVAVFTSSDGTSWSSQSATGISAGMADIAWGNGRFVAVGGKGATAFSTDGISWTAVPSGSDDDFKAVKYGDGAFMAIGVNGSVYTSSNGSSWEPKVRGHLMSYNQIAFGGGMYMAVGDSGAIISSDSKNWTKKYAANLRRLNGVTYGDNKFVAVSATGQIFRSENNGAGDWEVYDIFSNDSLVGVAYGGGRFVAVGKTTGNMPAVIYTSNNGLDWSRLTGQMSSTGWNIPNAHPTSICFGNGRFWAGSTTSGSLFSSENGSEWVRTEPGSLVGMRVTSINYTNGRFTGALGMGPVNISSVLSSSNGTNWEVFNLNLPNPVRDITYANGYYVAVGDSGRTFVSADGQSWSQKARVTNRNLLTIYSDANNVLAAGAAGTMIHSATQHVSVRYQVSTNRTSAAGSARMSVDTRSTPKLTLSFPAQKNAKITFFSLNGKTLYTHRLKAGEVSVELPQRVTRNGVVIAQYTSGGQKFAQRFQFTK